MLQRVEVDKDRVSSLLGLARRYSVRERSE